MGDGRLTNLKWVRENPQAVRDAAEQCRTLLDSLGRCLYEPPATGQITLDGLAEWVSERAAAGDRVICIDPITSAEAADKPWIADGRFVQAVKRTVEQSGASLILVSHPKKGSKPGKGGMDELAGGAAYQRFAQTIIWLDSPEEPKEVTIKTGMGDDFASLLPMERNEKVNRVVRILKSRNGRGSGASLGYQFDAATFRFSERGMIMRRKRLMGESREEFAG